MDLRCCIQTQIDLPVQVSQGRMLSRLAGNFHTFTSHIKKKSCVNNGKLGYLWEVKRNRYDVLLFTPAFLFSLRVKLFSAVR